MPVLESVGLKNYFHCWKYYH